MRARGRGGRRGSGEGRGRPRRRGRGPTHEDSDRDGSTPNNRRVCPNFLAGRCRFGSSCKFSHDEQDVARAREVDSSSGVTADEIQQSRDDYFDLKRQIRRHGASSIGFGPAECLEIWTLATEVMDGHTRELQQSVARDLADDEVGGPAVVEKTVRLCTTSKSNGECLRVASAFLSTITHPSLLRCLSIDSFVGTIYRLVGGSNGDRGIAFFSNLNQRLTEKTELPQKFLSLVVLSLYELLRRERKCLLNDDLPGLMEALEAKGARLANIAEHSDAAISKLDTVAKQMDVIRRMLDGAHGRLFTDQPVQTIGTTDPNAIQSTFPMEVVVPGGKHDNDFADVTKIEIFPTLGEITSEAPEYLPITDLTRPHFLADPVRRHIDSAFRLLRHDIFGHLKEVIGSLLSQPKVGHTASPNQLITRSIKAHTYSRASIQHIFIDAGLETIVSFAQPPQLRRYSLSDQRRWWEESSRLEPGGLVCFVSTQGDEKSFLLFVVVEKNTKDVGDQKKATLVSDRFNNPAVRLKLACETEQSLEILAGLYVEKREGLLLELLGLIPETFVPILENLQRMMRDGDLAFRQWILPSTEANGGQAPANIPPPAYARRPGFTFRLQSIIRGGQPDLSLDPSVPADITPATLEAATGLDRGQSNALIAALTREYASIQGPPGTGKSYLGVQLVRVLLDHKDEANLGPILVICYTNHALDQFLKHLMDVGIDKIIRIGGRSRAEELEGKNLRTVSRDVPKTVVENRILGKSFADRDQCWEDAGNRLKPLHQLRKRRHGWSTLGQLLRRHYPKIAGQFETEDEEGFSFVGGDPIQAWLGKTQDRSSRRGERAADQVDVPELTLRAERNIHSLAHDERWALAESWVTRLIQTQSAHISVLLDQAKDDQEEIQSVHDDVSRRTLLQADVVGITTTGLARNIKMLRQLGVKVIMCEEAAEVMEPHFISALMPGVEHFIQIGDHKQLRPQIQNYLQFSLETPAGRAHQLDRSQFERRAVGEPGLPPLPVAQLDVQRRMRPEISQLLRRVYPHLKDHDCVRDLPSVIGMRDDLFWLDHDHLEDSNNDGARVKSHSNQWEVSMATALVRHLVRQGEYKSTDIALLTPYTGQLQKLRAALSKDFEVFLSDRDLDTLAKEGFEAKPEGEEIATAAPRKVIEKKQLLQTIRLATVDNFQGEEAKVIVVSLVRSNDKSKVGFLRTENRINVLLSRAQHGMYLIGNAKTYQNVPMWADVLQQLGAREAVGNAIALCCPRHPETPLLCSQPADFALKSPEGGCSLICDKRLDPCGHKCPAPCHSDRLHDAFDCLEPCPRLRSTCQHPCPKLCGQECGPCKVKINGVKLPCGHVQDKVECYKTQDLESIKCTHLVEKDVPSCGHTVIVPCFKDVASKLFSCPTKCAELLHCGHYCPGTCGRCRKEDGEGAVRFMHQPCNQPCERPYGTCNHRCPKTCHDGEGCGSCTEMCEVRCPHSRCNQECQKPCAPCIEKCTWSCEHKGPCSLPCAAPCNRLPCDERCTKLLKCGHQCPSFCGENCPQDLCQICCTKSDSCVDVLEFKTYGQIDLNDTPIAVLGCGHFFTGETLDGHVGMSAVYTTDKTGNYNGLQELSGEMTSVPKCSDCRAPIRQFCTKRYNRVVNKAVLDETCKRFLVNGRERLAELDKRVTEAERELSQSREDTASAYLDLRKSTPDRYKPALKLEMETARLRQEVDAEHQPTRKLFDAVMTFQRLEQERIAILEQKLQELSLSEPNVTRFGSSEVSQSQPVYDQQITLGAHSLHLRIREARLYDTFTLLSKCNRSIVPGLIPGGAPDKRSSRFRHECEDLIANAANAKLPRLVIPTALSYARIAQLEGWYRRAVATAAAASTDHSTLPTEVITSASGNKETTREDTTTTALALLDLALALCDTFPGGAEYKSQVEETIRLFEGPRYETVTPDEIAAIKQAMVSGAQGLATHSGHWYTCRNGHPFAIGECGMPMERARCPECGESIGGQNHVAMEGTERDMQMETA